MFLESRISLVAAAILVLVGSVQSVSSRKYADAAKREATAVGRLTYVFTGRNASTYDYVFTRNDFKTESESSSCHTSLSLQGCSLGAPVMVYYDPGQIVETTLQEYGEIGREKLFFGICMILGGAALTIFHFVLLRMEGNSDDSGKLDSSPGGEPDTLQITPGE